jgi:APA family basic amino acid/polyamine antiporter
VMSLGELGGDLIGAAAVSLGFAGYFSAVFGTPYLLNALGLVVFMSFINLWGIRKSTTLTLIMTSAEVLGLLLIIAFGIGHWGAVDYFEMPHGFTGLFSASALIFFAYLGFEDVVNISEETKNATKVVPKALLLSLLISSILYVLVSISVVSIIDWHALSESEAPLKLVAHDMLGDYQNIMSFIILLSTGGTVLILLIAGSRMIYGLSDVGRFPKFLSKINKVTRTPQYSVLLVMLVVGAFVLVQSIEVVAKITDFTAFVAFGLVNLSNIALRYRKPDHKRDFKAPVNIGKFPVLSLFGFLSCVFMIFFLDRQTILFGSAFMLAGALLLFLWKKKVKK